MPSGDVGRPGWHKPVLVLAILLVVGQVVAFIVLRGNKDKNDKTDNTNVVAKATHDAAVESPPTPPPPTPTTPTETPPTPTETTTLVDAAVEPPAPIDAAVEETAKVTPVKVPDKKKLTRAELVAQQKKEREEKKREDEERRRAEQQERDRKKLEAERAANEQAKAAVELERQKLAAQRAETEAAAARAAADKAKAEAAAKAATPAVVTPATPAGPDVLVFVLGPGTPSVSSDQVRNVFLGRTTVWPNGTTARPLNRPAGTTAARKFYGGILKMNAGSFAEHWSEIQLGGGGIAPPTVSSGKVTVAKVAATSGGFGYVMESELPENTNGVRLVRLK
jgi:hypothetical protein